MQHKIQSKMQDKMPNLNLAQRILYLVYAVCLIVAGLDIWFWRA